MALLGRALLAQGQSADAEPLLLEACARMQPPPFLLDCLREALTALVELYQRQGRATDAAPFQARLQELAGR